MSIIGPIIQTTHPNVNINDVVFSGALFQQAFSESVVRGPFSLSIDVQNSLSAPVFIGIVLDTDRGPITVLDRQTLEYIPALQNKTITPASVPALARIEGVIQRITVKLYTYQEAATPSANRLVTFFLRIEAPVAVVGPQPPMGRDLQAFQYKVPRSITNTFSLAVTTNNQRPILPVTWITNNVFDFMIDDVSINLPITPYNSDIVAYIAFIQDFAVPATVAAFMGQRVVSSDIGPVYARIPINMRFVYPQYLEVRMDNQNNGKVFTATADMNGAILI